MYDLPADVRTTRDGVQDHVADAAESVEQEKAIDKVLRNDACTDDDDTTMFVSRRGIPSRWIQVDKSALVAVVR